MAKILFNLNGEQQLVEVDVGGGVTSDAEILFDDRIHGEMPEIQLGKMEAYDELELNEMNNEVLVRKLRILEAMIPSHAEKVAEKEQHIINMEAQAYLRSTDWLIIREMDSGEPCPSEIKAERAAARARIVE